MNQILEAAKTISGEIIKNRRTLHGFAEIGFDLPKTTEYVTAKLKEYGYEPQRAGRAGITCTAGRPGKTILLRADMDALPMTEKSGLPFAAANGNCHSCGHDCHTAMLLGAAKLLKERESTLNGTVKLMFQPAEELLAGAKDMVEHGVLENPKVDAAFGIHILVGSDESCAGDIFCRKGTVTNSGDAFRITIKGTDAHGSKPEKGVDAIHIAATTVLALEEVIAREVPGNEDMILLVGKIEGGTTCNSVAGTASLEISIRTGGAVQREFLIKRMTEISQGIACAFRGEAAVEHLYGSPALVNDDTLFDLFTGYTEELVPKERIHSIEKMGSEDFTMVAEKVPSVFFMLGFGSVGEGYCHSMHHPEMRINEDALQVGAAVYTNCAVRWLEKNT